MHAPDSWQIFFVVCSLSYAENCIMLFVSWRGMTTCSWSLVRNGNMPPVSLQGMATCSWYICLELQHPPDNGNSIMDSCE